MKFKRDSQTVLKALHENEAGQVLTKVNCKIQIPLRFTERGLGEASIKTFAYGYFPVILETGEYSVCNACALIELNPTRTVNIEIDETEYIEFQFDANTVVIKTTTVVQKNTLMYNILDEFIFKGKIPWYMGYEDIGKLFDTAKELAGSNVGENQEVMETLASMVARSKTDRSKYIRTFGKTYNDFTIDKIDYISLMSVFYAVNSTMNKIAGSYFADGVVSALVNPTKEATKIETILRA